MSIQYTVPGFELMTFETWVSSITIRPGLPPNCWYILSLHIDDDDDDDDDDPSTHFKIEKSFIINSRINFSRRYSVWLDSSFIFPILGQLKQWKFA